MQTAKDLGSIPPPKHILNAPTGLMKGLGYGRDYVYDHDTEEGFSGQNYFPEGVERHSFYQPKGRGFEEVVLRRLKELENSRKKKT